MYCGRSRNLAVLGVVVGICSASVGCQTALGPTFELPTPLTVSMSGGGILNRRLPSLDAAPNKRTCYGPRKVLPCTSERVQEREQPRPDPTAHVASAVPAPAARPKRPTTAEPALADEPASASASTRLQPRPNPAPVTAASAPSASKAVRGETPTGAAPAVRAPAKGEALPIRRVTGSDAWSDKPPQFLPKGDKETPAPVAPLPPDKDRPPAALPAPVAPVSPAPALEGDTHCPDAKSFGTPHHDVIVCEVPKELNLVNTPPYIIQTPDILLVEAPQGLSDQPICDQHLVRPDGTISLGLYGSVHVDGLTIDEARTAVEKQLSHFLKEPKVHVDVFAYHSKFYYIIADGGSCGQHVTRLRFTGKETVLDAISLIGGLPPMTCQKRIWIARPDPSDERNSLILPVDWLAIAQCGEASTNYQLFPGDRVYIQSDRCRLRPLRFLVGL